MAAEVYKLFSATERESLLAIPSNREELIRRYTLSESDLSLIRQHRGAANRLGFAVQLCYMRYPGIVLEPAKEPFVPMLGVVAAQLKIAPERWAEYGERDETRREHLLEIEAPVLMNALVYPHGKIHRFPRLEPVGPKSRSSGLLSSAIARLFTSSEIFRFEQRPRKDDGGIPLFFESAHQAPDLPFAQLQLCRRYLLRN